MEKISIAVPCYNEQEMLELFYSEVTKVADKLSEFEFEFLFVDDGSRDNTLSIAKGLADKDKRVKYISFSRNFGKEAALYAGLKAATGDYVGVMDVDLQDPPELLIQMVQGIREGFDCVATRRSNRKGESKIRSFFANSFYRIVNRMSKTKIVNGARDFRLMTRKMTDAILSMPEKERFSKGIFSWVGFKVKWLEYENVERPLGTTKWSFWGLTKYSMDGFMSVSTKPMNIAFYLTALFFALLFADIIVPVVLYFAVGEIFLELGTYIILGAMFFVAGAISLILSVFSMYISKIYTEMKGRPVYIVSETNTDKE